MTRNVFDINLLKNCALKYNATILKMDNDLCRTSVINFKCSCNIDFSKTFRMIVEGAGMYCDKCVKKISHDKNKTKTKIIKNKKTVYSLSLLNDLCNKYEAKLIGEYNNLNNTSLINFICKCNNVYTKTFRQINLVSGAYCKDCTFINQQNKTNRIIFNIELLHKTINRDSATLIGTYTVLTKRSDISYICKCGNNNIKHFYDIYKNYAICKDCSLKNKLNNMQKTCELRYGVKNPTQNPDILDKAHMNAKKFKKYLMPSGIVRYIQGYESFALDELIKIYDEKYIMTKRSDVPRIDYYDNNNIKHYYFPDIYIPLDNKIIEVKSDWTINLGIDIIELKAIACINNGYKYEIWIYDEKGNKTIKTYLNN